MNPNAIYVWGSGDGGKTWDNGGSLVHQTKEDPNTPYVDPDLDKPWIDVSWHPGTRGYVYVVYVYWDQATSGMKNRIKFRRSVNGVSRRCRPLGGQCDYPFEAVIDVDDGSANGYAHLPQVVVNPINGEVYVLWVRGNKIVMRTAPAGGTSFGPTYTVADVRTESLEVFPGFPLKLVPIARYNHVTNKMMVVWHDRPATSNNDSAIYLAYFTPSSIATTKPTPLSINNAAGYQYMPTIDHDDTGKMMIAYYSNETDLVYGFYQPYAILRESSGFGNAKGPTAIDELSGNWPGDYKDIWYFGFNDSVGPRWHTVHIFSDSPSTTRVTGIK